MKPLRTNKSLFTSVLLCCVASFGWTAITHAEPMQLLPRPQQAHYGKGALPVTGLEIRFEMPPTEEDRFAAEQLAAGLSAKAQTAVEVRDTGDGPAVLLSRTGEGATLPGTNEIVGLNSRESYSLKVTKKGAEITAPSSAGLFYGVQTLLQMVEGTGAQAKLPMAEIRDWPALAYRGFMMDFSHGQLLRIPEIKRQIDLLARYKANQYFFYSECNIEIEGYELVNPDARYSRAEIRDIIDYARQRHMDVVPCIEMYGHMHDLFRVEKFKDLGLPLYGEEFDPRNPRMFPMMDDWIDQMTKLFPSPWIHVGFDEPWSLGKIGMTPGKDPFQGFVDTLAHLTEQSAKHGRRLMFWADIMNGASTLSHHPE
ncbi:MAG TPA: beta-N-acetylhexosaminidase, partial [Verrucomicrobiae bacterium]|nr:beta-N-acetylhexosaminidase [Verrucomicrobiae bacterium]